jgi:uroporphyrinogen III methyltransferase/synthase
LKKASQDIEKYDWVIFTSANAVDVFYETVGVPTKLPKVAAIGSKTVMRLNSIDIKVDFVPEEYIGEALFEGLGDVQGKCFLLPRAKVAREILPDEICKAGGCVHEIAIYETVTAMPTEDEYTALREGVDVVSFTSPSAVNNFVKLAKEAGLDPLNLKGNPLIVCIGPVTEKAAREAGFSSIVVAENYTTEGLIEILKNTVPERK